jgi:hypothetical protein
VSLGSNKKYYENNKFEENDIYPDMDNLMKKKGFLDVNWEDGEIRQSVNVQKLMEEAKNKN